MSAAVPRRENASSAFSARDLSLMKEEKAYMSQSNPSAPAHFFIFMAAMACLAMPAASSSYFRRRAYGCPDSQKRL